MRAGMSDRPDLSIGMPAFNSEGTVGRAVESLLQQSYPAFELIISDNASTDGTFSVLERLAERDGRIRLLSQTRNVGAHANFGYVLQQARGDYFMWAAADDRWAPTFADQNVQFLKRNPDFVSSVSRVAFEGDIDLVARLMSNPGTYSLEDSAEQNLRRYLLRPGANSRFYGVHRTVALRRAWISEPFWAGDWAIVLALLAQGKCHEVPEVLLWRSAKGASSNAYRAIRALSARGLDTWLPMRRFSMYALEMPLVRRDPLLWTRLAYLNVRGAASMCYRHLLATSGPASMR